MRAIDLYSGVGGWSLGLRMSGIDVVASYEWWDSAASTDRANLGGTVHETDIRNLEVASLPEDIDVVVGSPPCTQFSFANRGGSGDIADGLKDIAKFLEVVQHLRPKHWAMENVPRVASILREELNPGRSLAQYADLVDQIEVVNMEDIGLPQRRRRMIAGSYPLELLQSYSEHLPIRTLEDVLTALADDPVRDPLYDFKLSGDEVTDHELEVPLTPEEERMNREAKTFHPIYNHMSFPDDLDRPSRTVTALCTRVSRESIIIEDPNSPGSYRRLTPRERASLQGFPITFQFFGGSYSEKLKLIGNALPPLLAYYWGHAIRGTQPEDLLEPALIDYGHQQPPERPEETTPPGLRHSYPRNRSFRAAIPNLRFASGMRFQLSNEVDGEDVSWSVEYFYGSSKDVRELSLDDELLSRWLACPTLSGLREEVEAILDEAKGLWGDFDARSAQRRWTHENDHDPHPFELTDHLGAVAASVHEVLVDADQEALTELVLECLDPRNRARHPKIEDNALWIAAGIIVGSRFNLARAT